MSKIIISNVLRMPKLEPIDWNSWWEFWEKNAKPLHKRFNNHNGGNNGIIIWRGFDAYRSDTFDPNTTPYHSELVDCHSVLPNIAEHISKLPIRVHLVRILQSLTFIKPHSDFQQTTQANRQIRTLLFDDNPRKTFYYVHKNKIIYQSLPDNSNTWMFRDDLVLHGSEHYSGYRKILITFYGDGDTQWIDEVHFPDHVITVEQ